jgi:hypothetical protein
VTDGTPKSNVTAYRLAPGRAEARIRQIAEESANVIFGGRARARMLERESTDIDVLRVLRTGGIVGAPEPAERGEWKCKIVQRVRGGREIGVVAIILRDKKLFIKTVKWEDPK